MNYKVFERLNGEKDINVDLLKNMNLFNEDTKTLLNILNVIRMQNNQTKIGYNKLLRENTTYSRNLLIEISMREEYGYENEFLYENNDKHNIRDDIRLQELSNKTILLENSYTYLKSVLSTRENLKNKFQRKEDRQKKAKLGKSGSNKSKSR